MVLELTAQNGTRMTMHNFVATPDAENFLGEINVHSPAQAQRYVLFRLFGLNPF